jgi:hypothetical protein
VKEESYLQGKEDAFEDILKWFLGYNNADFKHVPVVEFCSFLKQKVNEVRFEKTKRLISQKKIQSQLKPKI